MFLFPATSNVNVSSGRVLERIKIDSLASHNRYLSKLVTSEQKLRLSLKPISIAKKSSEAALISFIIDWTVVNALILSA